VAPGADDPREVLPVVHPARVARLTGIADEQCAVVPIGQRLLLGDLPRHLTVRAEADMAVGVDQPRHDVAGQGRHLVRAGGALEGQPTTDDPRLVPHLVGADEDRAGQVHHRRHVESLALTGPLPLLAMARGTLDHASTVVAALISRSPRGDEEDA